MEKSAVLSKITFVLLIMLSAGCTDKEGIDCTPPPDLPIDTFELEGRSTETYQSRIDFSLDHDKISKITFKFIIDDDDPNTNSDVVDHIVIAEHDTEGPVLYNYSNVTGGGTTPFEISVTMKFINNTLIDDEWQLYFYVNLTDSDDLWPGPLIFYGTRDTGYTYRIEAEYEYYPEDPFKNDDD